MGVDVTILSKYIGQECAEKIEQIVRRWEDNPPDGPITEETSEEDIQDLVDEITEDVEQRVGPEDDEEEDDLDIDADDVEGREDESGSIDDIDWDNIDDDEIPPDLSESVVRDLSKDLGYDKMYKLLSKLVDSKILQSITVPSHMEPTEEIERESGIGLPISRQEKWEVARTVSSWGQLFPTTSMGTFTSEHSVKRGPTLPTRAEYAVVMDTTGSMGDLSNDQSKFVAGFIFWLILKEARTHNDLVSFYCDGDNTTGDYELKESGDGSFNINWGTYGGSDESKLRTSQSYRFPATTNYDEIWNWFIKIQCNGGWAVNIMPYYLLALDAQSRTPASPLNLIIIGDFDDLDPDRARQIGLFLDFYERRYGELNVSVMILGGRAREDKFAIVERPRSEGGLGGTFINIPYGGHKPINPQDVFDRIKDAALRPNSPLKKLKFNARM